ncbi:MAG: NAD(P)/FAD-dependent oxidoreductase [Candidatus Omnitrophota bacterium]
MSQKIAIIIGAGPAGLTAAYELTHKTDIKPIVYEMNDDVGGISRTVEYRGNRIDIGGHRFFSKSDVVMKWWQDILPLQGSPSRDDIALGRKIFLSEKSDAPDPEKTDRVMLVRKRLSRIFYLKRFFNYPVTLNFGTISNLGLLRMITIAVSYAKARIFPIKDEKSLEDFFINRFGRRLYSTFFKDYTEKLWGIPCCSIKAEWGAQRVKGLSVTRVISHALKRIVSKKSDVKQKDVETSLIDQFMYPKFGPGQLWNEVKKIVLEKGGEVCLGYKVTGIKQTDDKRYEVSIKNIATGKMEKVKSDFVFSTMPARDLIRAFGSIAPTDVSEIAEGLKYRGIITVGVLLKGLKIKNNLGVKTVNNIIPDNWIYIQEREVRLGRIQVFNNWSPYIVKDKDLIWIGLEYFYTDGDELSIKTDAEFEEFAAEELTKIGFINKEDVIDSIVIRVPEAYPVYYGAYEKFDIIRDFTDSFTNLFLIGRNGMHRYNNMDHSMLTAMAAVDNIIKGVEVKENIWKINTETEYHEEK